MRRSLVALVSLLVVSPLPAQLHEATPAEVLMERAHHRMHAEMAASAAPAAIAIPEAQTRVFNIDAHRFEFSVNPSPFIVDEGDTVTLHIRSTDVTHGFLLENYAQDGVVLQPGVDNVIQFVANTPGSFTYFCIVPTCGTGHVNMVGLFVVNGASDTSPTIASIAPATGSTAGGTTITITGSNFAPGATVTIGDTPATDVKVVSSSTITAVTPLGPTSELAGMPRDVVVKNADGQTATKMQGFTYFVPPPSIGSLSPSTASTRGGTTVTIKGQGFTTAVVTTVTFGGTAATNVTIVDAVTLTATAPGHAAGAVDVTVQVGSRSATKASGFSYIVTSSKRRAVRP